MLTSSAGTMSGWNGAVATVPMREELSDALERFADILLQRASDPLHGDANESDAQASDSEDVGGLVRFLGQVAAGWNGLPGTAFPLTGAGYGSSVIVEDLDAGSVETFTLMDGPMIDFDAGQVSLASPIGQALLGTTAGAIIEVDTPRSRRRLRVLSVRSLRDLLESEALPV